MDETLRLGPAIIYLCADGLTRTEFPGGYVDARAHGTEAYRARAEAHGYNDIHLMSREHELVHSLLAVWLGLDGSPTFRGIAKGTPPWYEYWELEEAAVLAIQAFARASGIDIVNLARSVSNAK